MPLAGEAPGAPMGGQSGWQSGWPAGGSTSCASVHSDVDLLLSNQLPALLLGHPLFSKTESTWSIFEV